jgi:phosphoribosylanthranilate isomerase
MRVKICGMRTVDDIDSAVTAGAHALGFICEAESEHALTVAQARELIRLVPPLVSRVLVTQLLDHHQILELAHDLGVDAVQAHAQMSMSERGRLFARSQELRIIGVIEVDNSDDAALIPAPAVGACSHAVLVDTLKARGSTLDLTHHWNISSQIAKQLRPQPLILAGGLTPDNLKDAISRVRPWAVDVKTGVRDREGNVSLGLARSFVECALAQ